MASRDRKRREKSSSGTSTAIGIGTVSEHGIDTSIHLEDQVKPATDSDIRVQNGLEPEITRHGAFAVYSGNPSGTQEAAERIYPQTATGGQEEEG